MTIGTVLGWEWADDDVSIVKIKWRRAASGKTGILENELKFEIFRWINEPNEGFFVKLRPYETIVIFSVRIILINSIKWDVKLESKLLPISV